MDRAEALRRLAAHRQDLEDLGVKAIYLFGSVLRDQAGPASDVDLIAEFNRPIGLIAFVGVKQSLESILGCTVDLVTPDALRESMRDRILSEAVRAA